MSSLRRCDVFIGVKAEQSLRDTVRTAVEADEHSPLELTPVGRKDWIAGMRFEKLLTVSALENACKEVYLKLIALGSLQRVRIENIRMHVVQPHVPVFLDSENTGRRSHEQSENPEDPDDDDEGLDETDNDLVPEVPVRSRIPEEHRPPAPEKKSAKGGPMVCPVCQRTVHSYNLHYNTNGRIVGCFLCGGRAGGF